MIRRLALALALLLAGGLPALAQIPTSGLKEQFDFVSGVSGTTLNDRRGRGGAEPMTPAGIATAPP